MIFIFFFQSEFFKKIFGLVTLLSPAYSLKVNKIKEIFQGKNSKKILRFFFSF